MFLCFLATLAAQCLVTAHAVSFVSPAVEVEGPSVSALPNPNPDKAINLIKSELKSIDTRTPNGPNPKVNLSPLKMNLAQSQEAEGPENVERRKRDHYHTNCYHRSCHWHNHGYWAHGHWHPNWQEYCEYNYHCHREYYHD